MSKQDLDTFHLAVTFVVGAGSVSAAAAEAKIATWCQQAEALFDDAPALQIDRTINHLAVPLTSADLTFATDREFHRYMDDQYDNLVGDHRTEGSVQVLVVDNVTIGSNSSIGGAANFPHCVTPFGRKHGILLEVGALDSSFAHELGHWFSLKHTFEHYIGLKANCNQDFPKVQGGSRSGSTINLMDYGRRDTDTIVLNDCQQDRAAHQRRMYLTRDGDTNYRELAGWR